MVAVWFLLHTWQVCDNVWRWLLHGFLYILSRFATTHQRICSRPLSMSCVPSCIYSPLLPMMWTLFVTDASMCHAGGGMPQFTPEMAKMASEMMGSMPPEQLQVGSIHIQTHTCTQHTHWHVQTYALACTYTYMPVCKCDDFSWRLSFSDLNAFSLWLHFLASRFCEINRRVGNARTHAYTQMWARAHMLTHKCEHVHTCLHTNVSTCNAHLFRAGYAWIYGGRWSRSSSDDPRDDQDG